MYYGYLPFFYGYHQKNRKRQTSRFSGFLPGGHCGGNDLGKQSRFWSYIYGPFAHAEWHGWTPTDLIFPFFLFIVGVSIVLAFTKAMAKGMSRQELIQKTLIRGLKIFGLGLALAAFPYVVFSPEFSLHPKIASLRIPGVLQRIAVIYIMASFLFLYASTKVRWMLGGFILIGYWLAMSLIPSTWLWRGAIDTAEGNLAAYIDQVLLSGHMWKDLWDPEGILSTFPALVSTLMGVFIGHLLLKNYSSQEHKVLELLKWGFIWLTLGYLWSWVFPLNKNIWTSSFSLFTGGLASVMFGFCYWFIDVKEVQKRHKLGSCLWDKRDYGILLKWNCCPNNGYDSGLCGWR